MCFYVLAICAYAVALLAPPCTGTSLIRLVHGQIWKQTNPEKEHATYVQLRNNTPVEIHVKTANKLSFATRDFSANMGKLVMDVSECIIQEVVTMAPVKYEISWKCYLRLCLH
ncbi:hypothetical protein AAVH_26077 [Aphelenchoides avenae]|nr:hypothetical protein AAVH_26077 [Aphelenchus avenae]